MPPEDIDDLFRDQLAGHATPPGHALWARLHTAADAPDAPTERLDERFRTALAGHPTPPGRGLWERLEDEHLRPRQRRTATWWPVALAAALALLLVAGGAGLWRGFSSKVPQTGTVAATAPWGKKSVHKSPDFPKTTGESSRAAAAATAAPVATTAGASDGPQPHAPAQLLLSHAAPKPAVVTMAAVSAARLNFSVRRATRLATRASSDPQPRVAAPGVPRRQSMAATRLPDATPDQRPLLAHGPAPVPRPATDERQYSPAKPPMATVAPLTTPATALVPAGLLPAIRLTSAAELITVDVRHGADPAARAANTTASGLAAANVPGEPRRLGGRLLQQAGHLVRGERVSLAEVTGLPENVTLRATLAGRSLTKSIRL